MRTKGIRQAEGESPYTVKTKGAIWWKEEDSGLLTAADQSAQRSLFPQIRLVWLSGAQSSVRRTPLVPPPSTRSYTVS